MNISITFIVLLLMDETTVHHLPISATSTIPVSANTLNALLESLISSGRAVKLFRNSQFPKNGSNAQNETVLHELIGSGLDDVAGYLSTGKLACF